MHVAFQLKVPIDRATTLRDLLHDLSALYEEETAQFQKKIKNVPHSDKVSAESRALIEKGKRLTHNNLLRLVIEKGVEVIKSEKPEKILAMLAKDDVVRGRPRGR